MRIIAAVRYHTGSVAEWLNAPVLKTGDPKGFVSSNLTASANFGLLKTIKKAPKWRFFLPTFII